MDNGMGAECVAFPDAKSVMTFPDSTVWTFDAVFQASSKQVA